ncbi:MAG: hypothetical protein ACYTHN_24020 [Planctomycetota bacterium]|jgi:hypothetical protein
MARRKSAKEKMQTSRTREVKRTPKGKLLIPTPQDVGGLMRRVRKGKLATLKGIQDALAQEHRADLTCPLCTGIFARLAAEAAEGGGL